MKDSSNNLLIGDIVLICDNKCMPRNQWWSQKADEVVVGKDGKMQGAKLAVASKSGTRTTCYGPLLKLVEFEINWRE